MVRKKRPPKSFIDKTVDTAPSTATSSLPAEKSPDTSNFASWSRNVNPSELNNPKVAKIVARMLLAQNDKLSRELERSKSYEEQYHQKSAQAEVLKERIRGLRELLW